MKLLIKLCIGLFLLFPSYSFASSSFLERPDLQAFIDRMVTKYHFKRDQLIAMFETVKPIPQVIHNVKYPLEKETWKLYQRVFINDEYIALGADFRKKWHKTLVETERKYGVPGSIIIATLGVETKYGTHSGGYRVLDSLSNLGFSDQKRAPYFREELEHFLILCRDNHLNPMTVQGSYAGAIGAPQFMPSSYRYFAVSYNKKPHIDIVQSKQDAIASIGNYYKEHGWNKPNIVASQVTLKGDDYLKLQNPDGSPMTFSSSDLAKYGLVPMHRIPKGYPVKLITLEGKEGKEYWVVYHNFGTIKRYNPSNLYAMAVYQLSRRIVEYKG